MFYNINGASRVRAIYREVLYAEYAKTYDDVLSLNAWVFNAFYSPNRTLL